MSKTIKLDIPKCAKERNYRRLASEAAKDSIVTDALARLIEQIVREIHEGTIEPLRAELAAARGLLIEVRPFVTDSAGFTHHDLRARIDALVKGGEDE